LRPVITRNTTVFEKKQIEPVNKNNKLNIQQQVKEPLTIAQEGEYNNLSEEENET